MCVCGGGGQWGSITGFHVWPSQHHHSHCTTFFDLYLLYFQSLLWEHVKAYDAQNFRIFISHLIITLKNLKNVIHVCHSARPECRHKIAHPPGYHAEALVTTCGQVRVTFEAWCNLVLIYECRVEHRI